MQTVLFFRAPERGSWCEVVDGAAQYAREHHWMLLDIPQPFDQRVIHDILCGFSPDGLLLDSPIDASPEPTRLFPGIPTVCLDPQRPSRRFPALMHDQRAVARMAAEELMGIGLHRLAYVPFNFKENWSVERGRHFKEIVKSRGGTCSIFRTGSLGDFLAALPKPSGVFAANDMMAQRVMAAAGALDIRVPNDIAVIGVDDAPFYCESTSPGISSIRSERREVGYRFASILDHMMTDRSSIPPISIYSPVGITKRGSTRPLESPDPGVKTALEFIRRNACSGHISVDDIASVMKCPRCVATRRFRKATGRSMLDEVHDVRFWRMCELLRTTQTKISAIINFCGYSAEAFPKRYFLKRTGTTMREWRRMQTEHRR